MKYDRAMEELERGIRNAREGCATEPFTETQKRYIETWVIGPMQEVGTLLYDGQRKRIKKAYRTS